MQNPRSLLEEALRRLVHRAENIRNIRAPGSGYNVNIVRKNRFQCNFHALPSDSSYFCGSMAQSGNPCSGNGLKMYSPQQYSLPGNEGNPVLMPLKYQINPSGRFLPRHPPGTWK